MLTPSLISLNNTQSFVVDKPTVVIGRSKQRADFCIPDPHVSAVHCEIHFHQNVLTVKDKSKHGTWVNDQKVEEATVADGDVLRVVGHEFRVQWNPELSQMVAKEWLIRMAGMELGPLPWDELELMVQRGEVCPTDQVKATDSNDWQNVSELEHLFRDDAQELVMTIDASTNNTSVDDAGDPGEATTFLFDAEEEAATSEFELPQSEEDNQAADEPAVVDRDRDDSDSTAPTAAMSVGDTVVEEHSLVETTTDLRTKIGTESDSDELSGDEILDPIAEAGDSDEYELATALDSDDRPKVSTPAIDSAAQETGSDVAEYFYRIGNAEAGPIPLAEIQQLFEAGTLDVTHEVRRFGKIGWESVSRITHRFTSPIASDELLDEEYDSELLSDADQPDAELSLDAKESLPFGEPTVRRVNFDYQPFASSGKKQRASAGFGFGDWALGAYVYAQTNRIVAVSCLLILGWLIYGLIPKYEGVEVYGNVTIDGAPIKNASITFRNLNTGLSTTVAIAADGKYEATTLEGGLHPGTYQISFMPQTPESKEVVELLQEIYREEQGLQVGAELGSTDLSAGNVGTSPEYKREKLELPRGTIPVKLRSNASSGLRRDIDSESSPVDFKLKSNG